ncbi:hypothetical protein H310_02065 [Aphanomyces invadans]|uniref:Uncharacterized protein n=1 Tax=Aphanomyces invadans TaxID=157072 RepID=A0A024UPN0_9STRA|nr:hypothetical protein H310_02065 [Aphanomyces invadans]ETW07583.1 hypothetical protein H310_02065 [Aphanomyces invadans]|eukprot:XP_008863676.1 hypothetical protein H310_02065 [Aphanomyces invadans]
MAKICPSCTGVLSNEVVANAVQCEACKSIVCWWCDQVISKESIAHHYTVNGKGCRVVQLPLSPTSKNSRAHSTKTTIVLNYLWRAVLAPIAMFCAFVSAMCRSFTLCLFMRHEPLDETKEPPTAAMPEVIKPSLGKAEVHPIPATTHQPTSTHVIHNTAYSMYANL